MHFSNECFNSIFYVFYLLRTSQVHHLEDSLYTEIWYGKCFIHTHIHTHTPHTHHTHTTHTHTPHTHTLHTHIHTHTHTPHTPQTHTHTHTTHTYVCVCVCGVCVCVCVCVVCVSSFPPARLVTPVHVNTPYQNCLYKLSSC
jgi:hypothetical protein